MQGIDTFEAYMLDENNRMLEVFEASGFTVQRALDPSVFHVAFPTAETPQVRTASTERERGAAQSIRAFLNPRSVAVVDGLFSRSLVARNPPPGTPNEAAAAMMGFVINVMRKIGSRLPTDCMPIASTCASPRMPPRRTVDKSPRRI